MEDEERQKKLEAGKAKLAEYRQRKAHADGQKKQKKKKKKKGVDEPLVRDEGGDLEPSGGEEVGGGETREPRQTEFTFARTLRRGETVKHDQTYTIEPESEMSTTAEDYSTEVNGCLEKTNRATEAPQDLLWEEDLRQTVAPSDQDLLTHPQNRLQDMEDELAAKTQALEDLTRELEDIRAAFGTEEGVQQLQDFEAALKQRDGIITQLTANLQLARKEKDEVMREFLELTEQSQKLNIQFQQLQAGETLRNSSHSSTAADLLQARQQLVLHQQQLEERDAEVRGHRERGEEQRLLISQLQQRLRHIETVGTQADESLALKLQEKELLVAKQERAMSDHEHSLMHLREELTSSEQQRSVLSQQLAAKTQELDATKAEAERSRSELECTKVDLEGTKVEFERTKVEFESNRLDLERIRKELESSKVDFDGNRSEFESLKMELENSREELASNKVEMESNRAELNVTEAALEGLRVELEKLRAEHEGRRVELEKLRAEHEGRRVELESGRVELEKCKAELESSRAELESSRAELESSRAELESSRVELSSSRQKERMSSAEIQQLMGTVEDLQRRCHRGSLSEGEALQRAEEDVARQLERLRGELDEMYGEQIVQMKQALQAQHAAEVERLHQHHAGEMERLRGQATQSCSEANQLSARVVELQQKLQEAQVLRERARQELSQVTEEKLDLQSQVDDLLKDLRSAREKVEAAVAQNAGDRRESEAERLRNTISELEAQLAEAHEAAGELEAKHESEVTNYKIKLDMLEREKDAVLDRMAESQEAELERLRTTLLFSHEEELGRLRDELQRESQLNAENLRDELDRRGGEALEQLRAAHEARLRQAEHERADLAEERDALLAEMEALKEELARASLDSSRAEELVERLREMELEVEELRESESERADAATEREKEALKEELLKEVRERERSWDAKYRALEAESRTLTEDNAAMKDELELLNEDRTKVREKIAALVEENERLQQSTDELREEIERQKNTFSFAERNFEVNYQELRDECTCLAGEKAQLEERVRRETLEYEAKLNGLRSQVQQLQSELCTDLDGGVVEKDTTELMEKLQSSEKERERLAQQLSKTSVCLEEREAELKEKEAKLEQMEEELRLAQEEMGEVNARIRELETERAAAAAAAAPPNVQASSLQPPAPSKGSCSVEEHPARLASLEQQVEALRSQLQAAEQERRRADEQHAALQREKDGLAEQLRQRAQAPVAGVPPPSSSSSSSSSSAAYSSSSPHLSLSSTLPAPVSQALVQSESSQRQRQQEPRGEQRSTEPPRPPPLPLEEREREGEEEEEEQVEEKREVEAGRREANATGKKKKRRRRGMLHKQRVADGERQGSGDTKQPCVMPSAPQEEGSVSADDLDGRTSSSAIQQQHTETARSKAEDHAECLLQLQAQHISLSQIHAAQLELQRESLQEQTQQTQQRLHSLEQELQRLQTPEREHEEETRSTKYQNVIQAISDECKQVIQSFVTLLGEELVLSLPSEEDEWKRVTAPTTKRTDPGSLLQEAEDLCNSLYQLREGITQEYSRLQDLQASLKADGDKVASLQLANEELRRTSEAEISDLRTRICTPSLTQASDGRHDVHGRGQVPTAQADTSDRLRAEFQERQAQLEQRHLEEVERLRAYYQQQAKETQERYATEVILLQNRLQELTGTDAQFSIPSMSEHPMQKEEEVEEFKWEEDVEAEAELQGPSVRSSASSAAAGLSRQLQSLRQALYHKYLQEVTALKEQHRAELERLRRERQGEEEEEQEEEEEGRVTVNGEQRSSKRRGEQLTHSVERVEEEIAKVIVQMSVEFAQQTELARLAKQARETSSAMQTQPPEGEQDEYGEEVVDGLGLPVEEQLQEMRRRHREEVQRLELELQELSRQLRAAEERADADAAVRGPDSARMRTSLADEAVAWGPTARAHAEPHTKAEMAAGSESLLEELQRALGQQEQEHSRELEELRAAHAHQLEEQRDQQLQLSAQLHTLHAQLEQEAQMREADDGQTMRRERQTQQKQDRNVQSTSTQTEQQAAEEEDERTRKRKEETGRGASTGAQDTSSDVITTERNLLRKANERLRQVLSDVLKTTAAAEETIGRHVEGLLEATSRGQHPPHRPTWQRAHAEAFKPYTGPAGDESSESCHGSETVADEASVWSGETEVDEGLELSQQLLEGSLATGAALENEEYLTTISTRLQAAVEKLLLAISETTNQLEHARVTQTELMRESFRNNEEVQDLMRRQEELQEQLSEEGRAREQLALELHRAEGLIDGYTGERASMEAQVRQKEELRQQLEQELQVTASRLQELELERRHMQQERELLSRQQDAMKDDAGPRELHLLEETEKLMQEKVEVQLQAEKESVVMLQHLKGLEAELEEQVNRSIEQEQAHNAETADLRQQIQALEKQLEKNRKFLDEQAMDREHERDVFQQEILKLERQLKNPPKSQSASEQRDREVEHLSTQLQEKSDWCSELLLRNEQLQREAAERDEELERLGERVRQLEQALLTSTDTLHRVEESRQHAPMTEAEHGTLEAQLQTEREALDRKEKEICNLEEQLEQFREELENKSEEVQQLHMQLEIQRKELSSQQLELEAKASLLEVMEQKDREIALLNEQLAKLQHMEDTPDNKVMEERSEQVRELESQVEILRSEQERLKRSSEEEVDQLHAVIDKLQQEIANIEHKPRHSLQGEEEDEEELHKEEMDEMKQRMDEVTQELDTLKVDHQELQERYESLREDGAWAEKTTTELHDALREKAAALVVAQAQVQALEQSASAQVETLSQRVEELEVCVGEKDLELDVCRVKVERAQTDAAGLHRRVTELEDKLREKVAAMLVSQAQLGAIQAQTKELQHGVSAELEDLGGLTSLSPMVGLGAPGFDVAQRATSRAAAPAGKVGLLTEKLKELEEGLCGMQKDQELQKQLLSSSEEEVMEYERRLATLMDLLSQMKPPQQRTSLSSEASGGEASMSELLQELQEAQEKAQAAEEELRSFREHSHKLQQELQIKDLTIAQLQEDLKEASDAGVEEDPAVVSELRQELEEVREEASSTKEELSLHRERSDKLQEELLAREMTIAQLKDKLHRASGVDGEGSVSELLQELQEVREEVSSTKEELNSYRERSDKLQQELQLRDVSIGQLQEELQRLQSALAQSAEQQQQQAAQAAKHIQGAQQQQQQQQQQQHPPPSQPKKKGGKPDHHGGKNKGGAGGGKDKPSLSRKNSAVMQPEKSPSPSSSSSTSRNGRSQVAATDVATQTDLGPMPMAAAAAAVGASQASEEVAEVIGEYQEKIDQMQELHAAEIMDMEARHISESEGLRRDVQALEDECRTLKAIIDKLRSSEGAASRQEHGAGPQFKDGYTSDSSSDWSQRTGLDLQQEFRTTPEGARRDNEADVLPDRIKSLLREVHQEGMQVLSLSELPCDMAGEGTGLAPHLLPLQGWTKEREALLATVESLKTLIAKLQMHKGTQTEGASDWRGELLSAVQQVFRRERDVLKSALYSQLEMLDTSDAVIHLNQLEHRLREQDAQHREAMGALHSADRNSLLTEVRQLRAQMEHLQLDAGVREITSPWQQSLQHPQQQQEQQQQQDVPITGIAAGSREQEPERVGPQAGAAGAQDQQGAAARAERQLLEEAKSELAQTKLELETTLKTQHKHLKELNTLRAELTQKATEVHSLTDRLAEEQRAARELQWALEKEKCKSEKREEREKEELEDLKLSLAEQQALASDLSADLEEERQLCVQLKAQAQEQQCQQDAQLAQQQSRAKELQVQLESQQARAQELQGALERERELSAQLRQKPSTTTAPKGSALEGASATGVSQAEEGCSQVEEAVSSMEALLRSLQAELEQKEARVVQLLGELEAQRLEAVQQGRGWDEERAVLTARAAQEQQALAESRAQLERLKQRLDEAQGRLQGERERAQRLERERDRLQERVAELSRSAAGREATSLPTNQMAWRGEGEGEGGDRTRDWVLQQKSGDGLTVHSSTASLLEHAAGTAVAVATDANVNSNSHMDGVVQRLQLIASKIKGMTSDAAGRLPGSQVDREGLAWLQCNVDDVLSMLQHHMATQTSAAAPESAALLGGSSSSVLTERLLRQNAELTGFVSRLTEEKNDLRNQLLRLEDELRRLRQRGLGSDSSSRKGAEQQELAVLSVEREAWGRERTRMERSLRQAEAELTRLRGELRNDTLRDMTGPDADNVALKRMYGRYLRAESFRKALIYQKKYLLLLLGGFQECEEATLALIARMGGHPSPACLETITQRRRGFTRFRSAVRVSIALSRMRFLVKRWHKATGAGSGTSPCANRNGLSQITGGEGRHDSPFLHPGSVEVDGYRRGGSNRGRTGRDSPRSTLSAQHRYHGMAGEPGGGTPCSHLLNYDPDRALTDYIARLETLQRRLGSVQSGSSSYAQLHYGIRR
ncbi:A-kinase anchor protein 9 isoform X3 [Alosa sapidissima]|uniref:A-kinase anchor protein 9 isoform X3 n=1 Tax=Alosa sapidissima TaxID=34773 RepID=UPI001C0906DA|nr:A-kinase anchor protein 9 isoform X3 [Alosa sapidissima]